MLTVHHLENSRSLRILWLLEELGVEYRMQFYARDAATGLAPPELRQVHALGKAPIITHGDVTVAESGAIIEYLMYEFDDGALRPEEGTPERLAYTYWLHYAEGTFAPLMILALILGRIESAKMPFFARPIARGIVAKVRDGYLDQNIKRNLDFMDASLGRSRWFAGDRFTAADVQMSFALEAAAVRTDLRSAYPRLAEFLARIHERPAYKAATEKGGQLELMAVGRQ